MTIGDLPLDDHEWVTLVVHDGEAIQPDGDLRLRAQDRVLILTESDRRSDLTETFAGTPNSPRRNG
jgi:NhaP-type Na+/H+ and K+/H+ antiporter